MVYRATKYDLHNGSLFITMEHEIYMHFARQPCSYCVY